ncbi:MAG: M48 family peptidase [Candidatus Zixiibacteriota bacterium]|nr:MAG: M48 family peptidase [candidate division Zixibacteria bacterium]
MDPRELHIERRRVKYARIRVDQDLRVKVTVPLRYNRRQIEALLQERAEWIQAQLEHFAAVRQSKPRLRDDQFLYQGEVYRLWLRPDMEGQVRLDEAEKVVLAGPGFRDPALQEGWYRWQARRVITGRLAILAARLGLSYNRVFIRAQRTRWGACSGRKNLSFNWKLILVPPDILDYVIIHELTHTELMNHSPAFWARVAERCPDYRQARQWLRADPLGLGLN